MCFIDTISASLSAIVTFFASEFRQHSHKSILSYTLSYSNNMQAIAPILTILIYNPLSTLI